MNRLLLFFLPLSLLLLVAAFPPPPGLIPAEQADHLPFHADTFDQKKALADLRETIKGKEEAPAETVFQNIEILKGVPAGRVLRIMEMAFSRSLGVRCDHCHLPDNWASEEKAAKQITRDMWAMAGKINRELLREIENLESATPVVNCTTCHRGQVKPATRM